MINKNALSSLYKTAIYSILILSLITGINCKKNPVTPPDNLPDTTSHEISWEIDTIGGWQSRFNDIWGTDENNVYAVGTVFLSLDPYKVTNIMHWDGNKWEAIDYLEGDISGIYGFDKNNIWICGDWQVDDKAYALIGYWNGSKWQTWKFNEYPNLSSIWGTSSNNLYACGANGTILRYDGKNWNKITTNVTESLRSIWGNSENEIYAVGNTFDTYSWVVLKYDGSTWKKVKESSNTPEKAVGELTTIWTCKSNTYYTNEFIGKDTSWSLFGCQMIIHSLTR